MESSLVEKVNYSKNKIVDLDLKLASKQLSWIRRHRSGYVSWHALTEIWQPSKFSLSGNGNYRTYEFHGQKMGSRSVEESRTRSYSSPPRTAIQMEHCIYEEHARHAKMRHRPIKLSPSRIYFRCYEPISLFFSFFSFFTDTLPRLKLSRILFRSKRRNWKFLDKGTIFGVNFNYNMIFLNLKN